MSSPSIAVGDSSPDHLYEPSDASRDASRGSSRTSIRSAVGKSGGPSITNPIQITSTSTASVVSDELSWHSIRNLVLLYRYRWVLMSAAVLLFIPILSIVVIGFYQGFRRRRTLTDILTPEDVSKYGSNNATIEWMMDPHVYMLFKRESINSTVILLASMSIIFISAYIIYLSEMFVVNRRSIVVLSACLSAVPLLVVFKLAFNMHVMGADYDLYYNHKDKRTLITPHCGISEEFKSK